MGKNKYAGNVVESLIKFEERNQYILRPFLLNNRDSTIVSLKLFHNDINMIMNAMSNPSLKSMYIFSLNLRLQKNRRSSSILMST